MHDPLDITTLYRPTDEAELRLVIDSGYSVEYWIPAEAHDELNRHIVGPIRVIRAFIGSPPREVDVKVALAALPSDR